MEEQAKSEEKINGDRVDNEGVTQETGDLSTSATIVAKEAGKVNLEEEKLVESLSTEPSTASSDTNPATNDLRESSCVEKKLVEISAAHSVEETSAPKITETASGKTEVFDCKEATTQAETVEKSVTEAEEISQKEPEKIPSMDLAAEPSANQAMEVEEPVAAIVPVAIVSIQEQVAADQELEKEAVQNISNASLSMLCQYSGSSDSEAEHTDTSNVIEEAKVNSSSSSSDDSDVELVKENPLTAGGYRVQDDPILVSDAETMDTNAVSSEDENDEPVMEPIRTAGEILPHELPPIEELTITVPETECKPIGHIESIVAQIVLVQSVAGVELLNLDTVLFLERGKRALGKIFDVIGQVNQPIYCVLFNSNQEILTKNITTGMEVFCAPRTEYTSFIILSELMRTKGSDASWMHDNEIPAYMAEHSDDEEERTAKRNRKKNAANRNHTQSKDGEGSEMGDEQQHQNPSQPSPSTSRGQYGRPLGGRQFNPRYPSGNSWHHNYNPRFNHPQQYRPRFPPRNNQQQFQQIPHMQPPPQGGMFLRNPFASQGPPRPPPSSGSN